MTVLVTTKVTAWKAYSTWANRHRKWLFAAPAMIFVGLLIAVPLAWTVYLSLTDAQGSVRAESKFVGIANYLQVLGDTERFWPAVLRTFMFTGGAVAAEMVLGMGVALLLWRPFKGEKWVRVAILMPLVATPVATALPTLIFVDVWQWTPMIVLILLAGLTSLSEEPDEAARIDGANAWQRFRFVTLPLLRSTVIVAIVLRGIDALKTFDILYATKGKGGGSFHEVETLNVYAFGLSFDYNDYGIASTVLVLFFLLIIALTWMVTYRRKAERS